MTSSERRKNENELRKQDLKAALSSRGSVMELGLLNQRLLVQSYAAALAFCIIAVSSKCVHAEQVLKECLSNAVRSHFPESLSSAFWNTLLSISARPLHAAHACGRAAAAPLTAPAHDYCREPRPYTSALAHDDCPNQPSKQWIHAAHVQACHRSRAPRKDFQGISAAERGFRRRLFGKFRLA